MIVVILLHTFFTCAVAAGHSTDGEHTYDYSFHEHSHNDTNENILDNIEGSDHEHNFHAHVSCITGYSITFQNSYGPTLAIAHIDTSFVSKTNQPPVPPPNA